MLILLGSFDLPWQGVGLDDLLRSLLTLETVKLWISAWWKFFMNSIGISVLY